MGQAKKGGGYIKIIKIKEEEEKKKKNKILWRVINTGLHPLGWTRIFYAFGVSHIFYVFWALQHCCSKTSYNTAGSWKTPQILRKKNSSLGSRFWALTRQHWKEVALWDTHTRAGCWHGGGLGGDLWQLPGCKKSERNTCENSLHHLRTGWKFSGLVWFGLWW